MGAGVQGQGPTSNLAACLCAGTPATPSAVGPWLAFDAAHQYVAQINASAAGASLTMLAGGLRNAQCNVWRNYPVPEDKTWG